MKKYYPILLSKAGELTALSHLSESVKTKISPVIQILSENLSATENFIRTHWAFSENQILLDFSLFENIDERISDIQLLFSELIAEGVNVVPVIQQNSPDEYFNFVKDYVSQTSKPICIRASNDSGGFINFYQQTQNILNSLETDSSNAIILFDLAYVQSTNYINLATVAIVTLESLLSTNPDWIDIVVASGSFPENLAGMVPQRVYELDRYEWYIWYLILENPKLKSIVKYGDYGTKNPVYLADVNFAGTSSIKYTTENHFVIYRGELPQNNQRGMGQYIDQAAILVTTPIYSGQDFSWGDQRINEIVTENNRSGNPRTWVEISQNHHISLITSIL